MTHDQLFSHAVTLAAAFVANGDIRLPRGSTKANSQEMDMTCDLIEALYERLAQIYSELLPDSGAAH